MWSQLRLEPVALFTLLRVDHGHRSHVDDLLEVGALFEYVNRAIHSHHNRADRGGAAEMIKELVGNVAGAEIRKYQHVRRLCQRAERVRRAKEIFIHRRIGLHLTIYDKVGMTLAQNGDRIADLARVRMADGAEVGKRQHGDTRLDSESAHHTRRSVR